jgi:hypothetical protein
MESQDISKNASQIKDDDLGLILGLSPGFHQKVKAKTF